MKMPWLYRIGRFLLGPFFMWYYNPKVIGKENIPKEGQIIIAGNHKHLYDQCMTIVVCKRFIKYMAKKEYFDSWKTRWFFKGVGCISVNRQVKDNGSKEEAIEHLKKGGAIGIFPEGTRNKTDKFLLEFKFGAVSMAQKTDAMIVPFGITGDYKFRSKNLIIRYGKPFKVGDMSLVEANDKLYHEVEKLMKQNLKEGKHK
ncbi:MAG: 1-acyl-sn-glycerol-3-phosphate acyltransferase [Bacilli bacterium]|nr:1-acyl-sn-glycerol-3-phosphate acyltransferase [Bacilli bacterium]